MYLKILFLFLVFVSSFAELCFSAGWLRTFDAKPYTDYARFITASPDGGWIVSTTASDNGSLLKLSPSGNIQWLKTYDLDGINSSIFFFEVYPLTNGYAAAGSYYRHPELDGLIVRMDNQGNILWQKILDLPGWNQFHSLTRTSDGGWLAAGSAELPGSGTDLWFVRMDDSGNVLWEKALGSYGTEAIQYPSVHLTSDGGFIIAAYTNSYPAKSLDAWILKMNASGNVVWNHTYGSTGSDGASAIRELQNGDYIVAGWMQVQAQLDLWAFRISRGGDIRWQRTLSTERNDGAESLSLTKDGGFVIGGHSRSFGPDQEDAWLVRMNAAGQVLWQKKYGTPKNDWIESVHVNKDGSIVAAGITDPSQRLYQEAMVFKLNPSGEADFCFPFISETSAPVKTSNARRSALNFKTTTVQSTIKEGDLRTTLVPMRSRGGCDAITSVEPPATVPSRVITLKGNFDGMTPENSRINLGNQLLDQIVSWTDKFIFVKLPEEARTAGVSISSQGRKSTPLELYILPTSPSTLWPLNGPGTGKTRVVITLPGDFNPSSIREVRFGSVLASNISMLSSRAIVCTSPAGNGKVSVSVVNEERTWVAGDFEYVP